MVRQLKYINGNVITSKNLRSFNLVLYLTTFAFLFALSSICFSEMQYFKVTDGCANATWEYPNDQFIMGYYVYLRVYPEKWSMTPYETLIGEYSTSFDYPYCDLGLIFIRIHSYNASGMPSEGYLEGKIRLASTDPPEKLDVK